MSLQAFTFSCEKCGASLCLQVERAEIIPEANRQGWYCTSVTRNDVEKTITLAFSVRWLRATERKQAMKDFRDLRRGDFVQSKEYPQGLFVSEVRGNTVTVLIPKVLTDPVNWEIKPLREVRVEDVPSLPPTRRPPPTYREPPNED